MTLIDFQNGKCREIAKLLANKIHRSLAASISETKVKTTENWTHKTTH